MASFNTLVSSLPKFGHAGASIAKARAWNPRVFAAATPRPIQVPPTHNQEGAAGTDGMQHGASETVNNSMNESTQDKAYSTAEHMTEKASNIAGNVSATAQNITERAKQTMQEAWDSTNKTSAAHMASSAATKAKQTMQDAWDSTLNTATRAADTVLGKTQESAESVKQNAEAVRRSMNRKD